MSSTEKILSSTPHTLLTSTFSCAWCGRTVSTAAGDGTRRNHCPSCLHSQHVLDRAEGGASDCEGRMAPIAVAVPRTGEWMVIHRCVRCDELTSTSVCADDNQLVLMRMAVRPLAQPPFPLEAFGDL
ncbi:RNHCP domain-containing protein [Streptomyces sp. DT20]|uniref:RNHCP domain-containing protein n=1 Tax=unclassified Streptomyces TaxID=2593676 RepID=UPI00093ACDA6|nr:RNHCP domain-containing protein [Streptomyces sp. CB02488]OKK23131.1 RNHCP domain protein [Streptomyces sp. CB02488]WRZ16301.1 RNHCP domain-containing protein [Streptomyces sp. NBC_00341]